MKKINKNFTWIRIAETVVVIWAIHGMFKPLLMNIEEFGEASSILIRLSQEVNGFLVYILTYFLSAALILYLLRRYKK